MKLIENLGAHIDISEEIRAFLKQNLTTYVYPKNTTLLNIGQVCDAIYFVESGLVQEFCMNERVQVSELLYGALLYI